MLQKTTNKPTTCQKDGSVRNNLFFFAPTIAQIVKKDRYS